jgi:histidinol phosphatase-like enzyme
MLQEAARDLTIDVSRSWMVGDSERDLGAAAAFGIPAVLVASDQLEFKEDVSSQCAFRVRTLKEAVQRILSC